MAATHVVVCGACGRSCRWSGGLDLNCSHYFHVVDGTDSVCYKLRNFDQSVETGNFQANQAGEDFALTLTVDLHQPDTLMGFSDGAGVRLMLWERGDVMPLKSSQSCALAPGFEHFVAIERHVVQRMSPPYNDVDCIQDANFTMQTCLRWCWERDYYVNCSCYSSETFASTCTICDHLTCVNRERREFFAGNCDCKFPCREVLNTASVTSLAYPADNRVSAVARMFEYGENETVLRKNVLKVSLFFKRMEEVHSVEQAAVSGVQVISDIGGALGLCVGASLITLVEFCEFFAMQAGKLCRRRRPTAVTSIEVKQAA